MSKEAQTEGRLSCTSQGWEARRAGKAQDDNPFPYGSWQYEGWKVGWLKYVEPKVFKRKSKGQRRTDDE